MARIVLENIKKVFNQTIVALDNISLSIEDREYVSILGTSGSGKTTLLRIIAGFESPETGKVFFDGQDVSLFPPEKRNIGFVFQDFALFPHLSVWENVAYGPKIKGLGREQVNAIGRQTLEIVGLFSRKDSFPHELSGGMKQRVGLARAMASGSKILLMDEPLGSLDARIKRTLKTELRNWVKELGLTAIHVGHSQLEAMEVSDRLVIMDKGRIIQSGPPEEIYKNPNSIFVADFISESNFLTGTIENIKNQHLTIGICPDSRLQSLHKNFKLKQKVVVSFRPEEVKIHQRLPNDPCLKGSLIKKRFLQGRLCFTVRLVNQQSITVSLAPSSHNSVCKEGEVLYMTVSPSRVLLFPYPKSGLKQALRTFL
ncbi:MAG: ABC transporter ATP-binding protein [Candidatus Pacebacteria bacterium]|nr:ABC transporter ATP-binding protein [Candidatus Paceibacterota bacterium]